VLKTSIKHLLFKQCLIQPTLKVYTNLITEFKVATYDLKISRGYNNLLLSGKKNTISSLSLSLILLSLSHSRSHPYLHSMSLYFCVSFNTFIYVCIFLYVYYSHFYLLEIFIVVYGLNWALVRFIVNLQILMHLDFLFFCIFMFRELCRRILRFDFFV